MMFSDDEEVSKGLHVVLQERYIFDLLKRDFDIFERATIIKEYMQSSGLSQSGFCRKFNIPKTTLHTWLIIGDRKDDYENALKNGSTKTQAFKLARGDRVVPSSDLDFFLDETRKKVRDYRKSAVLSKSTVDIIRSLINELNVLHMELERKELRR